MHPTLTAALADDYRGDDTITAYAATVARDVATIDDLVSVSLVGTDDQGDLAHENAPWPAKGSLPERGDRCLVVFDNTGRPWVVAWDEPGWGS